MSAPVPNAQNSFDSWLDATPNVRGCIAVRSNSRCRRQNFCNAGFRESSVIQHRREQPYTPRVASKLSLS
jgi:hypothetical protein